MAFRCMFASLAVGVGTALKLENAQNAETNLRGQGDTYPPEVKHDDGSENRAYAEAAYACSVWSDSAVGRSGQVE